MGEMYTLEAIDNGSGIKKQKDTKSHAPFPCVVFFYRSNDQAQQRYGTEETGYNCSYGFDTYIPILMGASTNLLRSYKENIKIPTSYDAKKKKGVESIYISKRERTTRYKGTQ